MRKLFAHTAPCYRLGITATSAALLENSGWQHKQTKQRGQRIYAPVTSELWGDLRAELNELMDSATGTNRPLAIVVADQWVRLFVVTPPRNARSLKDCEAAAAMRFQELYGDSARQWKIRANWQATQAFVACAMPASLFEVLLTTANAHRMTLTSVAPHFVAAWNRWFHRLDGKGWFGVAQENSLTLAVINEGTICAIQTLALPDHAWRDPQWLTAQLARQALIGNVPATQKCQLCGHLPGWPGKSRLPSETVCRLDGVDSTFSGQADSAAVHLALTARVG